MYSCFVQNIQIRFLSRCVKEKDRAVSTALSGFLYSALGRCPYQLPLATLSHYSNTEINNINRVNVALHVFRFIPSVMSRLKVGLADHMMRGFYK